MLLWHGIVAGIVSGRVLFWKLTELSRNSHKSLREIADPQEQGLRQPAPVFEFSSKRGGPRCACFHRASGLQLRYTKD
jgi:hypothetical protein